MAARAIWKGVLEFGGEAVPVKLYSAVESQGVHFRLLHEKDEVPVKQHMVNPESDEVVDHEEIQRGFEVGKGQIVVLDEEELAGLEPKPSRSIELTRFVPEEEIGHAWYDRPYFLGPDGDEDAYFALVDALDGRAGVARWTMRKKAYLGALRVEGDHLMLITLRNAAEVVDVSSIEAPTGRDLSKKEIAMAGQLIAALEDDFDPAAFRDEYRERVLELVEAKAEGKTVSIRKAKKKKEPASLEKALRESIAATKKAKKSA